MKTKLIYQYVLSDAFIACTFDIIVKNTKNLREKEIKSIRKYVATGEATEFSESYC